MSKKVPNSELTYSEYREIFCSLCTVPKNECSGHKNTDIESCADPDNY